MIMLNVTLTCPGTRAFDIRVCATRLHAYCEASMLQQIQAAALTRLTLDDFWEKIYRYNTQQQQNIRNLCHIIGIRFYVHFETRLEKDIVMGNPPRTPYTGHTFTYRWSRWW